MSKGSTAQRNSVRRTTTTAKAPAPVQQARTAIVELIRNGRYSPGQRLVMAELVSDIGLGVSIVRDALRILGGEGIVELIPNKGARVPKIDRADVVNLLEALEALGAVGLRRAATQVQAGNNAARLKAALRSIKAAARNGKTFEFLSEFPAYHQVVNEISGNTRLNSLTGRVHLDHYYRELTNAMIARAMTANHWQRFLDQYERITDALLEGEAATAERVFAEHMRDLVQLIGNR